MLEGSYGALISNPPQTPASNVITLGLRLEGPKGSEAILRQEAADLGYNVSRVKQRDDGVHLYATKGVIDRR